MEGSYGVEKVGGRFKDRVTTMPELPLTSWRDCSSLVHVLPPYLKT